MNEATRKSLGGAVVIVAVGLVIGLANNLLAGPERRLEWKGSYPEKGEPPCKKVKAPGTEPLAVQAPDGGTEAPPVEATAPPDGTAPVEAAASGPTGDTGAPIAATSSAPAGAVEVPPVPAGERWIELKPEQTKALFDQGALFIDARRTSAYEEGHVQGAMSIPIWESGVDEKIDKVIFDPRVAGNPAANIVVYCNGGDCEDSHMVGDKLWEKAFTAVYVYHDGWPNWSDNKWPMTTGAQP